MKQPFPTRGQIADSQLEQLRTLLTELFPANSFYARKLQSRGLTFDVSSLDDFSRRFPFTTKTELVDDQSAHPPFGTNLTSPFARYTRCHQTSGTSGRPLRWLDTPESWNAMVDGWVEIFLAAGVESSDRVYFAFSFGPFIGFWLAFEAAAKIGCLCFPGGGLSTPARARGILETGATVLCCTPTYAIHLAQSAAEEKIDLTQSKIRTLIVAGEPGGSVPAIRKKIESLWPAARVFDHHGMTEVGPVTHECPNRPGVLHVLEPDFLAEVCDGATGTPVRPGQTGELVLTTLARVDSPVLRYRTGDLVRLGTTALDEPCACGRATLTLEGGILGRLDDMVVVRGVNIFPAGVDAIIQQCPGIAEYQVRVDTKPALAEISVTIEPGPECKDPQELISRLERSFQTALALRVTVTVAPVGSLPRSEMKAQRWLKVN